jgi:hypothetical protein
MGAVIGLGVDSEDNVSIVHRQGSLEDEEKYATWNPKAAECCMQVLFVQFILLSCI